MTLDEARARIGRLVTYWPAGQCRPEVGRISSVTDEFVFVVYGNNPNAAATHPRDIIMLPGVEGHCAWCDEPVLEGEQDEHFPTSAMHAECGVRSVIGSVGHQRGLCSCFGGPGEMDDPRGMTRREAAKAAAQLFHNRNSRGFLSPG